MCVYIYIYISHTAFPSQDVKRSMVYMRSLLGWLETRLAQITSDYLKLTKLLELITLLKLTLKPTKLLETPKLP